MGVTGTLCTTPMSHQKKSQRLLKRGGERWTGYTTPPYLVNVRDRLSNLGTVSVIQTTSQLQPSSSILGRTTSLRLGSREGRRDTDLNAVAHERVLGPLSENVGQVELDSPETRREQKACAATVRRVTPGAEGLRRGAPL